MTDAAGTRSVLLVESEEASRNRATPCSGGPASGSRLSATASAGCRSSSTAARTGDHRDLGELAWGDHLAGSTDQVKLYVSYLRRKLRGAAGVEPISTVRGFGYRYDPN
ncbi:MAG: winged helix-turn-helix domain-containing protein [Solirubrobacterales bacterium]